MASKGKELAAWAHSQKQGDSEAATAARLTRARALVSTKGVGSAPVEALEGEVLAASPASEREAIVDDLWPLALAAAKSVLEDESSPASARVSAMKVVWEAKVGKATVDPTVSLPQRVVYECAAYAFADDL